MKSRYVISLLDVLFMVLMAITIMFVMSLILINPPAKKADIDSEDTYMVVLEWDRTSASDIDLHLLTPYGKVGFNNRQNQIAYQDRDDLGKKSDEKDVNINKEVIYIKKRKSGFYVANVHVYSKRNAGPENIEVSFYQIKPVHMLLFTKKIPNGLNAGQEYTAFTFTIQDEEPYISFDDTVQVPFIVGGKME